MREIARFIAKEIEPMRKRQGVCLCKGNMKYKMCWTFAGSCGIGLCCKEGAYMQLAVEALTSQPELYEE